MFWILILSLLVVSVFAAYRGFSLLNWTLGMALVLAGFAIFTSFNTVGHYCVGSVCRHSRAIECHVMALPMVQ